MLTHRTVKTLIAPGYGGLPGPHRGPVPLDTEAVALQSLVKAAQKELTLHLEMVGKRPEGFSGPRSRLCILI